MSEYETLAKNVLKKTLHVKPGENVTVETWNHGIPIAREFVYQIRAMGARSLLTFEDEEAFWRSAAELPKAKQGKVGSHEWAAMKEADAYVFITGPADIVKMRELREGYNGMVGYNSEWYERAEKYRTRGARIGLGYVTEQRARAYGFDLEAWRRMMLDASSVDPSVLRKNGQKIQRLLGGKGHVLVTHPNGTHFEFDLAGRKPVLDAGVVTKELLDQGEGMVSVPAGELAVLPDQKSGEGTIRFDRPIASFGRLMTGVTIAFENGRVAKWSAAENEDMMRSQWQRAKGGKDLLAGFQIGLNPAAQTGYLQDYLVAGNAYVAIGDAEEFGGKSTTDFYLASTLSGATVAIDDKTVVERGKIV
ncbi:MAG TPA: aminopeptidase [Thermoplasmata archaeon]|nr:aminopeptidase [Thermoplasmata archaeon]